MPKSATSRKSSGLASPLSADEVDQTRLITKVAWMYHYLKLSQGDIAEKMSLSQSVVSRFLKAAKTNGTVQIHVTVPRGLYIELESALESEYGLREAHVFDVNHGSNESELVRDLGQLLASRLAATGISAEVIGFTSWSRSLRATVAALHNMKVAEAKYVVEMLGDVGDPAEQHDAALSTQRLAEILGAEPRFLRVPGVTPSKEIRDVLVQYDQYVQETLTLLDRVELALVGIGTCEIVAPLVGGDNFFTEKQFIQAKKDGAVGQVNLRFIDEKGLPVQTKLDELIVGVTLNQLKRADRSIGVAGGPTKFRAIRAAIRGGWVNTLVTDVDTAKWLLVNSNGKLPS